MKKRRVIVSLLGLAAVLIMAGLAALLAPVIRYRLREAELIEAIQLERSPGDRRGAKEIVAKRDAAVRELGAMRSVRAIPYIIELWGVGSAKDRHESREAVVAIGKPAIRLLGQVLRGEIEDPSVNRRLMAIITCKEMGPAALPLLPELLEWYRRGDFRDEVVEAIRGIGEPESVAEVAGWTPKVKDRSLLRKQRQRALQAMSTRGSMSTRARQEAALREGLAALEERVESDTGCVIPATDNIFYVLGNENQTDTITRLENHDQPFPIAMRYIPVQLEPGSEVLEVTRRDGSGWKGPVPWWVEGSTLWIGVRSAWLWFDGTERPRMVTPGTQLYCVTVEQAASAFQRSHQRVEDAAPKATPSKRDQIHNLSPLPPTMTHEE